VNIHALRVVEEIQEPIPIQDGKRQHRCAHDRRTLLLAHRLHWTSASALALCTAASSSVIGLEPRDRDPGAPEILEVRTIPGEPS
jgi:hypothetical protein